MKTQKNNHTAYDSPATMVAVAVAAHRAGDREVVRIVKDELRVRHEIVLVFKQKSRQKRQRAKDE